MMSMKGENMNQEKIGKFIAECRKNKNMTQQDLAEKLGVSDRTIGNWENGRNMPDSEAGKMQSETIKKIDVRKRPLNKHRYLSRRTL